MDANELSLYTEANFHCRRCGASAEVFPFPVLELPLRTLGREYIYERLSGSLVADPFASMRMGWTPPLSTAAGTSV
jgi:hypothetical protein